MSERREEPGALGRDDAALREADAAARLAAQRIFDRPLVIEAGAGTGKTSTLVARILAWCTGPGWERHAHSSALAARGEHALPAAVLERVTALTFTEAAAAEMAARTAGALAALARGEIPSGVHAQALPPLEVASVRAARLLAEIERLEVRTIHAWCRRVLADHALAAGLHPDFAVDADGRRSEALVREVLERRFAVEYRSESPLLHLAHQGVSPREIEDVVLELVAAGVPADALASDPATPERLAHHLRAGAEAVAQWRAAGAAGIGPAADGKPARRGSRAQSLIEAVGQLEGALARREGSPAARLESVRAQLRACDAKDWGRLADWARGSFQKGESEAAGGRAPAIQTASAVLLRWIETLCPRSERAPLLDPQRLALVRAALEPLLREIERELRARGIETFAALLRHAHALLSGSPQLCARIRGRIDQLLVDEFQDTDALQCDLVRLLALAGAPAARPGLFVVGDPKQSIYGWRDADLAAYESFVAEVCQAGGQRELLCVCFRSGPAILAEVERLIAPVMIARPGLQPPFRPLLAARADGPGTSPAVEHWVTWVRDRSGALAPARGAAAARSEAAALALALTLQHEQGVPWSDMAVLLRSRGDLDVYLEALRRSRVPYHVEGHRAYYQRREVIEAAALLRAIADPNDALALLAWLRSSSVGVPDAALLPLWERGFPGRVAALAAPDAAELEALRALVDEVAGALPAVPGSERIGGWEHALCDGLSALAQLRRALEDEPADRFVELLRTRVDTELCEGARALGQYRVANLERFFAWLADELGAGADVHDLLRALRRRVRDQEEEEEGRPLEAGLDRVSVRTIHQAKGLDFAHVHVMQTHKRGRRAAASETACGVREGTWEYRLLGALTPGFKDWEAERERVEQAERVRTLYVALTRAKSRLVIAGVWPDALRAREPASHVELMAVRAPGPELLERARDCVAHKEIGWIDGAGVQWLFPALDLEARAAAVQPRVCAVPAAPEQIRRESRRLAAARRDAARHAARPFAAGMSTGGAGGAELQIPAARESDDDEPGAPVALQRAPGDVAAAVGTALHRVFEALDLDSPEPLRVQLEREWERAEAGLARCVAAERLRSARQRAAELRERVAGGALLARLESLRPHVVARELPVWLAAPRAAAAPGRALAPEAPVSHHAGVIDLLYRDPSSGQWVIVDYKTDRIDDPAQLAERAGRYAAQTALYAEALRGALALAQPPRVELWFLAADRAVAVERPARAAVQLELQF